MRHVTSLASNCWDEIKELQGGLYQLQDKIRRLHDRGFSRSRFEYPKLQIFESFIEGASFSPGRRGQIFRRNGGSAEEGFQWGSCGTSYCQSRFASLYRDYRVQSPACTASASIYLVDVKNCKNRVCHGIPWSRRKNTERYRANITYWFKKAGAIS